MHYAMLTIAFLLAFGRSSGVEDTSKGFKYAVVMDAGSTGTRVHIYSWDPSDAFRSIHQIASTKYRIPLSSLVDKRPEIEDLIKAMVDYADVHIPAKFRSMSTVCLKATAGLRKLSIDHQHFLMSEVQEILGQSGYQFIPTDTGVIPGHEEALYDYMAAVVALEQVEIGVLDMGGASKQLSYILGEPKDVYPPIVKAEADFNGENVPSQGFQSAQCMPDYVIRFPGTVKRTGLVARSIQGLGLLSAMDFILDIYMSKDSTDGTPVMHPCLAVGSHLKGSIHEYDHPIDGYGNVTECYELIRHHFLDKIAAEIDLECLQKHKPKKFVALDNFPKLIEMLGLMDTKKNSFDSVNKITPQSVLDAGHEICSMSWEELLSRFPSSYPAYRAQRACFGSAYIYFFMKDVYGIEDHSPGEFFPLDSHNDLELSWVLGAVAMSTHEDRQNFVSYVAV